MTDDRGQEVYEWAEFCTLEYAIPASKHFDLNQWASDLHRSYLKVARTNSTWVMTDGKTDNDLGTLFEHDGKVYSAWYYLSCGPRQNWFVRTLVGDLIELGATMTVRPFSREDYLAAQRLLNTT